MLTELLKFISEHLSFIGFLTLVIALVITSCVDSITLTILKRKDK